jgi:hypothetical protein
MLTFGSKTAERGEKSDSLEKLDGDALKVASEYRERARAERKRFELATDTEFWLAFCFPDLGGLKQWRDRFGFGELHEITTQTPPRPDHVAKPKLSFGRASFGHVSFAKPADPLADVKYTGDFAHDCRAELDALHDAMVVAHSPEPLRDVTDSDVWFVSVFPDRDSKDEFLKSFGLQKFGDKYVDGLAVLRALS